jgi:hypothetical protein
MYNFVARAPRSSGETVRGGSTAVSAGGDLGGVRVVGKDVCLGAVIDVGDEGGLQYDVAFWNGGGYTC